MQAQSYLDVRRHAPAVAREEERRAFDEVIERLTAASEAPDDPRRAIEAARYTQKLWGYLIKDLSNPSNDLSDELKGNLISIGLWILREIDAILSGTSDNWTGLIDINRTVREGLSA